MRRLVAGSQHNERQNQDVDVSTTDAKFQQFPRQGLLRKQERSRQTVGLGETPRALNVNAANLGGIAH